MIFTDIQSNSLKENIEFYSQKKCRVSNFFILYIFFLLTFRDSCVIIIINNCNLNNKYCNLKMKK